MVFNNLILGETDLVPQLQAPKWINENVIGKITKQNLDDQRMKEVGSLDIMQTTSIIYHVESILEMQFLCLLTFTMFY